MQMKYEFVDGDVVELPFRKLRRIRALRDIPAIGVKAGDLGGYIEQEWNLSQDGDAWVRDNARVYGIARVAYLAGTGSEVSR